jgi:hypothetical protein
MLLAQKNIAPDCLDCNIIHELSQQFIAVKSLTCRKSNAKSGAFFLEIYKKSLLSAELCFCSSACELKFSEKLPAFR